MQRCFLLLFLLPFMLRAQPKGLHPGLSVDSFRLVMPGVVPDDAGYEGHPGEKDSTYGINAFRTYTFRKGHLETVSYAAELTLQRSNMDKKESIEKFSKCRAGTMKLLNDYVSRYGAPVYLDSTALPNFSPGDSVYTTKLLNAEWLLHGTKIRLKMSFYSSQPRPNDRPREYHPNDYIHPDAYEVTVMYSGHGNPPGEAFQLDMTADALAKQKPKLFPKGTGIDNSWRKEEKQFGLHGSWIFVFKQSVLVNFYYEAALRTWNSTKPFPKRKIHAIHNGANRMEKEMTKRYGAPLSRNETTDTIYESQKGERRWNVTPLEVSWKNAATSVSLRYSGRGERSKGVPGKNVSVRLSFCDPSGTNCGDSH